MLVNKTKIKIPAKVNIRVFVYFQSSSVIISNQINITEPLQVCVCLSQLYLILLPHIKCQEYVTFLIPQVWLAHLFTLILHLLISLLSVFHHFISVTLTLGFLYQREMC